MGYLGSASIDGSPMYLTGSSLNPVQELNAPELIQGRIVKHVVNYGKTEIGGNFTGAMAEDHAHGIWTRAYDRDSSSNDHMLNDSIVVEINYYRSSGRTFKHCCINSFEITLTAGDIAYFTIDFMSAANPAQFADEEFVDPTAPTNRPVPTGGKKMITWDRCAFNVTQWTAPDLGLQAFSFSINNNLQRVYCLNEGTDAGTENMRLFPCELVAGFRDITGSVSVFSNNRPETMFPPNDVSDHGGANSSAYGADSWDDYGLGGSGSLFKKVCQMIIGKDSSTTVIDYTFTAAFRRPEASARSDLQIVTMPFVGIGITT